MLTDILYFLFLLVLGTNIASVAYVLIAIRRVEQFHLETHPEGNFRPPVTVFKPEIGRAHV